MIRNESPDSTTDSKLPTAGTDPSETDASPTRRDFMSWMGLLAGGAGLGLSATDVSAAQKEDLDDVEALNVMLRFERLHRDFYQEFAGELDDVVDGDHDEDEEDLQEEEEDLEEEKEEIEEDLEELEDERVEHQEDDDDEHDDGGDNDDEQEEAFEQREQELEDELGNVEDELEEVRDEQDDENGDDHNDDGELQGVVEQAFEEDTGLHRDAVERFHSLADHEEQHVKRVEQLIEDLGGTPDAESDFSFNDDSVGEFTATAATIGEATVKAYADIVPQISDSDAALEAMRLCVVEARHAAFVSGINGDDPFPQPFAQRGSVSDAEKFLDQF